MDAIEALKTRRSIRGYLPDSVPKEIVEDLVDCGRQAATARNIQPWLFVVVTDLAMRRLISETADYGKFIAQAPVCIVVLCEDTKFYLEDGCAAIQNILVAARAHGLGSCWVAGDKKSYAENIRDMVGAPKAFKLIGLIAVGKGEKTPDISKKPIAEVMRWEKY